MKPFTLDEALEYAERGREDVNVMLDVATGEYHVIREYAVDHYLQFYKNIAEIRVTMTVKLFENK